MKKMIDPEQKIDAEEYTRWNIHCRRQHFLLLTSFIVLAFTGVPIRYAVSKWASSLAKLMGGYDTLLSVHLAAAFVMIVSVIYHLFEHAVCYFKTGKVTKSMIPSKKDISDLWQHLLFCLGLRSIDTPFDRYTYKEKFEYWAVAWGLFSMVTTGLIINFTNLSSHFLPRSFIDAFQAAHSGEAMLAILTIIIWHWFNVLFHPVVFPMSKVWLNGKISIEEMAAFHPLEMSRLDLKVVNEQNINQIVKSKLAILALMLVYILVFILVFLIFKPMLF